MHSAYILLALIGFALILFIWGKWRFDLIAVLSLIIGVILHLVPVDSAFTGLANPAVITVACVMIITRAINDTGIVEFIVNKLTPLTKHPVSHIGSLCLITSFLSAFMNNVGALALMMPVAIKTAKDNKRSPSLILMPLAFASAMGGLMTSIGTPPNLLISAFRQKTLGQPFTMFDFSPIGVSLAILGVVFVSVIGWRLLPHRHSDTKNQEDLFKIEDYITEVRIDKQSTIIDKSIYEVTKSLNLDIQILGLIRRGQKRLVVPQSEKLLLGDILIIEISTSELQDFLKATATNLVAEKVSPELLRSDRIRLMEAVVPAGSRVEGRSSANLRLRYRYKTNLLAISREGSPFRNRLNQVNLRAGDIVLLQGEEGSLQEVITRLGFLPLVERGVDIKPKPSAWLSLLIFAIAIVVAAIGWLPIQIAFVAVILAYVFFNVLPIRTVYDSIDWPIIILLAAMIPLGQAMQSSGGTLLITEQILGLATHLPHYLLIGLLMLITMTLSDFMNNAATAVVMAPIALSLANALHVHADPLLMTVAVGASCSFLTPIGHQNNTLVMGPGGYKFYDYIRLGLPLEILVLALGVPLILMLWPL